MFVRNFGKFAIVFEVDYDLPDYVLCTIYDRTGEDWVHLSQAYGKSELIAFKRCRRLL